MSFLRVGGPHKIALLGHLPAHRPVGQRALEHAATFGADHVHARATEGAKGDGGAPHDGVFAGHLALAKVAPGRGDATQPGRRQQQRITIIRVIQVAK